MPSAIAASSVLADVTAIFRDLLHDPSLELTPGSSPDDVPGWDSMTHIALVVEAECRFGVQFRVGEIEGLHTVGDFVRSISAKRMHAPA